MGKSSPVFPQKSAMSTPPGKQKINKVSLADFSQFILYAFTFIGFNMNHITFHHIS